MKMYKKRFKKIYIEITNICNLSCSFCPNDNRQKEYMTIEKFNIILDKIKDYTDYIYLHVKGEPLMHPYINEFIELAYQKNFKTNITTNGTLIDKLTNKNIRQINYSIQSTNDVEQISTTIKKIRAFIKDTNIYLSLRLWSEQSQLNNDLRQTLLDEFKIETIEDKKEVDKNIFISIEKEFEWPDLNNENASKRGYCYGLKDQLAILVDGTVVPCCLDHKGIINLGNIYQENLSTILESKHAQDIVSGFNNRQAVEELCQKCKFRNRFEEFYRS